MGAEDRKVPEACEAGNRSWPLTFHQLPDVHLCLVRGFMLQNKAVQAVWAWRYQRVHMKLAWYLGTACGNDLTVVVICLIL